MADVTTNVSTATTSTTPSKSTRKAPGLSFRRYFTETGISPYETVEWELRDAVISDASGAAIFEQNNVEVPRDSSMPATNIVASNDVPGRLGTRRRQTGARHLISRFAEPIRDS